MSDLTAADLLSDESLVGRIADEFTERVQRGERPDVEEYARRHPRVAELVRQVLPVLQVIGPAPEPPPPATGPGGREVVPGCLGDFRLVREVGRGGMGVVYEAVQLSLNRRVALKVLPFASALDGRQLQRFKNEAQAAAALHHAHIVPVFGVGCDRGTHYYAMQFIEGESLATLVQEVRQATGLADEESPSAAAGTPAGGLFAEEPAPGERGTPHGSADSRTPPVGGPAPDTARQVATTLVAPGSGTDRAYFLAVARLGIEAAEALDYAHQQGVVHRDVKPANLLVDVRGRLWITDFGLVRLHGGDSGLTLTGDVVGTLRYMSPEQARGSRLEVDHRTDVYSLGVTLYELLTLRPAHGGRDREQLLRRVASEEPAPPRRFNRAVPRELETVVLKAMAKSAEERYATAQELADDLQRFLDDRPIRARRPSWVQRLAKFHRRHRAVVSAVVAGVVFGLLACTFLVYRFARAEAEQRRHTEETLRTALRALDVFYYRSALYKMGRDPARTPLDFPLLQETLDNYERIAEQCRGNPNLRAETAVACARVADLRYALGELVQSESSWRNAVARYEALLGDHPDDDGYRLELAFCLDNLGVVLARRGHGAEAEQAHRRALALLLPLAAERPDDDGRRKRLADCYYALGTVLVDLGRPLEAEEAYLQSLRRAEKLVRKCPDGSEFLYGLAEVRARLALLLWKGGRHREAEAALERARETLEDLCDRFPDPWYKVRLGQTLDRQGRFCLETGRLADAERCFRDAIRVMEELSKRYKNVPLYRVDLAAGRSHLALPLAEAGKLEDAERLYLQALRDLEALGDGVARDQGYREILSEAQNNYGNLLGLRGDFRRAAECFRAAYELRAGLAQDFPGTPEHRSQAASACINLGTTLRATGHPAEAETEFRRAADLCAELVDRYPAVPEYRSRLAASQTALGLAQAATGRLAEAERSLRRGKEIEEGLADQCPRVPEYRDWIGRIEEQLGAILRKTGRAEEAAACERRALERFQSLTADFPTNPSYRAEVSTLYDHRAQVLQAAGRCEEAERASRHAIAVAAGLVADFPKVPDYARLQATADCRLGKLLAAAHRYRDARRALDQAVRLDPRHVDALTELAWLLATCPEECYRDPARAVRLARQAVCLAPQSTRCWIALGVALYRAGQWAEARGALEQGLRLRPAGDGRDALFLAMACCRLGDCREAGRWYEEARRRLDEHPPADESLRRARAEAAGLLGRCGGAAGRIFLSP